MISYLDLQGASGAAYRFTRVENASPPTAHSGIYLYVRESDGERPVVLFIAETENLMTGATGRWAEAISQHGATTLFTRLHVGSAARRAELADILALAVPAMNPPVEASAPQPVAPADETASPPSAQAPAVDEMDIPSPPKA